ncbi:MAG: Fic family protein [Acidimicrobiales bacterium]
MADDTDGAAPDRLVPDDATTEPGDVAGPGTTDARDPEAPWVEVAVPPFPDLPVELLEAHATAHRELEHAVGGLSPDAVRTLGRWLTDHTTTALAGIYPSISGAVTQPLFPPPRAFLSRRHVERRSGVAEAYRYIDVQVTLARMGLEPHPLRIETPFVLHALVEGRRTSDDETNPAVLRSRTSAWVARVSPYAHPPAAVVRPLAERIVIDAAMTDAPAPAVAAWIAFCWMSLHPWVDGNGRTARLLYLLVAARSTPSLDLGAIELMTERRNDYVQALQQGQWTTPTWDAELLDATPFAIRTTQWSVLGAQRNRRRAEALDACVGEVAALGGLEDAAAALIVHAGIERLLTPAHLEELAIDTDEDRTAPAAALEALADLGALVRRPLPPSRRVDGRPGVGYAPAPALSEPIARLLAAT